MANTTPQQRHKEVARHTGEQNIRTNTMQMLRVETARYCDSAAAIENRFFYVLPSLR